MDAKSGAGGSARSKSEIRAQRSARFEQARFFRYLPARTADELDLRQRRDIAHTIFELQRSNPGILQELYFDNPYVVNSKEPRIFRRIKRRFYLMIRTLWFSLLDNRVEHRQENRIADLIFMLILSTLGLGLILGLGLLLYGVKSAAGIDLIPGIHLFCECA